METSNAEGEHSKAPGSPSQPQSRVFARVYPLVVLSFLGSGAFGILTPVLPILLTEVRRLDAVNDSYQAVYWALIVTDALLVPRRGQYFARVAAHGAPIDCGATPHAQVRAYGRKKAKAAVIDTSVLPPLVLWLLDLRRRIQASGVAIEVGIGRIVYSVDPLHDSCSPRLVVTATVSSPRSAACC